MAILEIHNIKYNAGNTDALTLVLQVYTFLADSVNSNYTEIPLLLFMVRSLPLCAFVPVIHCT